jgi:pilus assembly protein CpaB
MVAVSVELKEAARVGTFVLAGSKISLFDNFISGKSTETTRVLVPSALVLGVGSTTSANATAAGNANLVTLALTPKDALRVIHAQSTGVLYAALVGDVEPDASSVATDSNLFGGSK